MPAVSEDPRDGPEGESFAHLPSTKLLTDLIEATRFEMIARFDGYGTVDEYPCLSQLWGVVRSIARAIARDDPDASAPRELQTRWSAINASRKGEPRANGWRMSSSEAEERLEAITDFLVDTGPLSLREAERAAPVHWLSEKELKGT